MPHAISSCFVCRVFPWLGSLHWCMFLRGTAASSRFTFVRSIFVLYLREKSCRKKKMLVTLLAYTLSDCVPPSSLLIKALVFSEQCFMPGTTSSSKTRVWIVKCAKRLYYVVAWPSAKIVIYWCICMKTALARFHCYIYTTLKQCFARLAKFFSASYVSVYHFLLILMFCLFTMIAAQQKWQRPFICPGLAWVLERPLNMKNLVSSSLRVVEVPRVLEYPWISSLLMEM